MTTPTFSPPVEPDNGIGSTAQARVLQAQFGDGYTQRAADGLNSIMITVQLTWSMIGISQATTIENFFIARKGHEAFYWTRPGDTTPKKWIVTTWQRVYAGPTHDQITADFQQVFDL